ncbi:MAG: NmrA family NAD(P)-binding protein [Caldilineaceae bacterium]|nr:NmrA family NAD(P)-binding protein [Caldilineaceae bacterium]
MNIVVTGSLGNISKPLTETLLAQGHAVTVISHSPARAKEIKALGATAAIGTMEDADFLAATFTGADAVYCMISAGGGYFDANFDLVDYATQLANNYKTAIERAGVHQVVFLSSVGAHLEGGNGILAFYYHVEKMINELPPAVAITFMRPVAFYNNLLGYINPIKTQGMIAANYGGDEKRPWVSPLDIAAAVAQELTTPAVGRNVRYVASDEISCNEIATILGEAIGKPELQWLVISDEQLRNGLVAAGMNPQIAAGMVAMYAAARSGKLSEDYERHRPVLGNVKMQDYAKEFARVYNQA